MKLKDIFKTVEGIIVLSAFVAIIVTGAKMFAWLGLGGYVVANLNGGIAKAKKIINSIVNYVKNLLNKE